MEVSLKPLKKSDLEKTWMKKRFEKPQDLRPERHLIVSEGTETEPAYFEAIKDIINAKYRESIQLEVIGEGDNTIFLFERAQQRASHDPNGYRHVWIVYDTDDFPSDRIDTVVDLCHNSSTGDIEYHAIWSNQCIELWYLLHFSFMHSDIHRTEYWPKLTEWLTPLGAGAYTKNRSDMFAVLRPYLGIAIANANRLEAMNEGLPASKAAPGTMVHKLLEHLKPYLPSGSKDIV